MPDNKSVNKQLKAVIFKIKNDFGLKQSEIADKLGITSTYLSDMINGWVPLTETITNKLYEEFQIRVGVEDMKNVVAEPEISFNQTNSMEKAFMILINDKDKEIKEYKMELKNLYEEIGSLKQHIKEIEKRKANVPPDESAECAGVG